MDEASLSKQEAYDILIGRLREGGEQGWLSATFTPKGKTHWTYKKFGTGQPDTELIHAIASCAANESFDLVEISNLL